MRETWFLFRHFWKADVRAQHSIAGLVLFAIATVYAAYQVVQGRPEPETWNALAWIILLFTAFNGVSAGGSVVPSCCRTWQAGSHAKRLQKTAGKVFAP